MAVETHLVSVVITTYNHSRFIETAIRSVLAQEYKTIETIVVDDGSNDNTASLVSSFPGIKYIYQENKGLSAARNTGLDKATGEYICFLDADDWLLHDALFINEKFLSADPKLAFVAGAHKFYHDNTGGFSPVVKEPGENLYHALLNGNFIGMHAAVLYRTEIIRNFRYDENLSNCEDYDLYLRIARVYPIQFHKTIIAVYRKHQHNMSADNVKMLEGILFVINRHKELLTSEQEIIEIGKGIDFNLDYYSNIMHSRLMEINSSSWQENDKKAYDYLEKKFPVLHKEVAEQLAEQKKNRTHHSFRRFFGVNKSLQQTPFDIRNLPSEPVSLEYGNDRGGMLDQYYINKFLSENSFYIHGKSLEFRDNIYSHRFGGDKVSETDVIQIVENISSDTDKDNLNNIPNDTYDVILFINQLQLVYDFKSFLDHCFRILKPGGTLFLTVPGISSIPHDDRRNLWQWSFTDNSLRRALEFNSKRGSSIIKTYGNVYMATAFLYGFGITEVNWELFDKHDEHYQLIISGLVKKL